jgi:hypothetical protein
MESSVIPYFLDLLLSRKISDRIKILDVVRPKEWISRVSILP